MKKKIIYKDVDLMSKEEINGYIEGFEWFMRDDIENYVYTQADEEMLYEYIRHDNQLWWEEVSNCLREAMYNKRYKIEADLGLWYGRRQAHTYKIGFSAITCCLEDGGCDLVEIYETAKGTLKVDYHHHDGTNYFTIKEETAKGIRSTHFVERGLV